VVDFVDEHADGVWLSVPQGTDPLEVLDAARAAGGVTDLGLDLPSLSPLFLAASRAPPGSIARSPATAQQARGGSDEPAVVVGNSPGRRAVPARGIADPSSVVAVAFSMIPFSASLVMPVRWAAGEVPIWHLGLSMALTAAAEVGLAVLGSRVYALGITTPGRRIRIGQPLRR
jgi:ABC-type Na+ efflux pump permease subunit